MRRFTSFVALIAAFVLSACAPAGSGNIVTEHRTVDGFDSMEIENGIEVDLVVDPSAAPAVDVVYDDNLQERILVSVDGGTLHLSARGSMSPFGTDGRYVRVTTPSLTLLNLSGGAQIDADGEIDVLDLEVSGGGIARLGDLLVEEVLVDISGGGSARINVSETIEGQVDSGGSLTIDGDPAVNTVTADTGARVEG